MNDSFRIVGLGEVLWDLLPAGRQLGGAPANFVCHAQALGADARLVSRVGEDELGREIIARLHALGVGTDCITLDPLHATGTVGVELENGQPRYRIHEGAAWDFLEATFAARSVVAAADAICFGTLAQRSAPARDAIRNLAGSATGSAWRVCDINLRQQFYSQALLAESLHLANALKLNDAELPVLAGLFELTGDTRSQLAALVEQFALRLIVLTRGANGSILFDGAHWSEHEGSSVQVADTIGAGDSFTAATILGVLSGWDLDRINVFANELAAFVCSQPGATPPLPPRFTQIFSRMRRSGRVSR